MDWGDTRKHDRGGGRAGRGHRRGRYRHRASNNHYFEPHAYQQEGAEQYQPESSQKDESEYQNYHHGYRGRGRGRGGPRGHNRGGYRGGRGRYRRGGYQHSEQSEEGNEFNYQPYNNQNKAHKIQHKEYNRRENQPRAEQPEVDEQQQEEAKVYYQADDFLKKYDKLPEKTEYLVKELCDGSAQWAICHNEIAQISAIWSCKQCYQPLHLGCIRRWIKKVNDDNPVESMPYENRKEEVDQNNQVIGDNRLDVKMDEFGAVHIDKTNCYTWTCPNCTYNYTEPMPKYECFCAKEMDPDWSSFTLPHSCSKICNKKKNKLCSHNKCNLECHPGAWVPCEEFVTISCYCDKATRMVICQVRAQKQHYSCREICRKPLNCRNHVCEETCHEGPCRQCQERQVIPCFCGGEEIEVACGVEGVSCHNICNNLKSCGNHKCQKTCHSGECSNCEFLPERVKLCPCGKASLRAMGAENSRKSCLDPIPTCNGICGKIFPCGTHHCKQPCHEGPWPICENPLIDVCRCGRGQRKIRWYEYKYPIDDVVIHGEDLFREVQAIREKPFHCNKKCNKIKTCKKHRCQRLWCPVMQAHDASGAHICLETCNKDLPCGKHKCTAFCHTGPCEPCAVYYNEPVSCSCGHTKIQPPVRCGEKTYCFKKCQKVHEKWGHSCGQQCHPGPCPPCTEGVAKECMCGKLILDNVKCGDLEPSCGQIWDAKMPCEHFCRKMCHDHKAFIESGEVEEGCGQKCNKKRMNWEHKCQAKCHGQDECPDYPCDAEIKIPCKCGYRHITGVCNRYYDGYEEEEQKKIDCNAECMKNKRDAQIAKAFKNKDEKKQKELKADYYPENLIEFAVENIKTVVKFEKIFEEVVRTKSSCSLPDLEPGFKRYISILAREHYCLDLCTYGGRNKNNKRVTDVYYKDETTQVPATLLSDYVKLISKGILSGDAEERKNKLFEASIKISELPIGGSLDELKQNLIGFHSEFYTEKIGTRGGFYLHFYNKYRAEEAFKRLRSCGGGYSYINLLDHTESQDKKKVSKGGKKKKKKEMDFEGFTEV